MDVDVHVCMRTCMYTCVHVHVLHISLGVEFYVKCGLMG